MQIPLQKCRIRIWYKSSTFYYCQDQRATSSFFETYSLFWGFHQTCKGGLNIVIQYWKFVKYYKINLVFHK